MLQFYRSALLFLLGCIIALGSFAVDAPHTLKAPYDSYLCLLKTYSKCVSEYTKNYASTSQLVVDEDAINLTESGTYGLDKSGAIVKLTKLSTEIVIRSGAVIAGPMPGRTGVVTISLNIAVLPLGVYRSQTPTASVSFLAVQQANDSLKVPQSVNKSSCALAKGTCSVTLTIQNGFTPIGSSISRLGKTNDGLISILAQYEGDSIYSGSDNTVAPGITPQFMCDFSENPYRSPLISVDAASKSTDVIFISPILLSKIDDQLATVEATREACLNSLRDLSRQASLYASQEASARLKEGSDFFESLIETQRNTGGGIWINVTKDIPPQLVFGQLTYSMDQYTRFALQWIGLPPDKWQPFFPSDPITGAKEPTELPILIQRIKAAETSISQIARLDAQYNKLYVTTNRAFYAINSLIGSQLRTLAQLEFLRDTGIILHQQGTAQTTIEESAREGDWMPKGATLVLH